MIAAPTAAAISASVFPATECSLNASRPKRAISFVTRSRSMSNTVLLALIGSSIAVRSTSFSVEKALRIRAIVGAATAFGSPSI